MSLSKVWYRWWLPYRWYFECITWSLSGPCELPDILSISDFKEVLYNTDHSAWVGYPTLTQRCGSWQGFGLQTLLSWNWDSWVIFDSGIQKKLYFCVKIGLILEVLMKYYNRSTSFDLFYYSVTSFLFSKPRRFPDIDTYAPQLLESLYSGIFMLWIFRCSCNSVEIPIKSTRALGFGYPAYKNTSSCVNKTLSEKYCTKWTRKVNWAEM